MSTVDLSQDCHQKKAVKDQFSNKSAEVWSADSVVYPLWHKEFPRHGAKKVQPMQVYILSNWQFEKTFENAQWGKAKQMQPV